MKISYLATLAPLLVCLIFICTELCAQTTEAEEINRLKMVVVSLSVMESETNLSVLKALQENDTEMGKEILEVYLDYTVCRLWEKYNKYDEQTKIKTKNLLKAIKAYRDEHPRKIKVFASDKKNASEVEAKKQQAEKILSGINF